MWTFYTPYLISVDTYYIGFTGSAVEERLASAVLPELVGWRPIILLLSRK
jgi:hypothetical protein